MSTEIKGHLRAPRVPWRSILAVAISLELFAGAALAETAAERTLRAELAQRDQLIADLQRRMDALEQRLGAAAPGASEPAPRRTPSSAGSSTGPVAADGGSSAPGQIDVDELAAERALERTLVSTGVLLLPAKQVELEPFVNFARRENEFYRLAVDPNVGASVRAQQSTRNEYDMGLLARVGLPYDSQIEVELPYRVVNTKQVEPIGLFGQRAPKQSASSIGDVKIALAKTLFKEKGLRPDLVGRVTWNTGTGPLVENDIDLGTGYQSLRASLSAVKRQDPLAFTLSGYYRTSFERNDIEPGDDYGFTIGTSLAVSPETALSVALAQSFSQEASQNGDPLRGSGGLSSVLAFGASSVISKNALLAVSVGVGLTDEAPDYVVSASVPIRF